MAQSHHISISFLISDQFDGSTPHGRPLQPGEAETKENAMSESRTQPAAGPLLQELLDRTVKLFWASPVREVTDPDGTQRMIAVDDAEAVRITVLNFIANHDGSMDALGKEIEALAQLLDGSMLYAWEYALSIVAKAITWVLTQLGEDSKLQEASWDRYVARMQPSELLPPSPSEG
jgi:hypothetical protein